MRLILLSSLLLLSFFSCAQTKHADSVGKDGIVFKYVEQMPEFPYGYSKYLMENIRYPKRARRKNIEGRVVIKFIVNEDGSVSDCTVTQSVDDELDEEALRVIRQMPRWKPGMQNGKVVKVFFTAPITFKLED